MYVYMESISLLNFRSKVLSIRLMIVHHGATLQLQGVGQSLCVKSFDNCF